jgi:hypothetical protein
VRKNTVAVGPTDINQISCIEATIKLKNAAEFALYFWIRSTSIARQAAPELDRPKTECR